MIRWVRVTARGALGLVQLVPALALVLATLFDRGPSGNPRFSPHLFPVVLWIFDDFAWTCARNSLVFALLVSLASLLVGVCLTWLLARRRLWGKAAMRGLVVGLIAAPPAFMALGILGLLGTPGPWPWPFAKPDPGGRGASLESWAGIPLWSAWVWAALPQGAAMVVLATIGPVERLEHSWEDAARLAGAGPFRIWRSLSWPMVRPPALRAAALVFFFALVEPGAPLILDLRRTLALQIVEAAGRSDPFPQAAVWTLMAGLYGWAGWLLLRWRARSPVESRTAATSEARNGMHPRPGRPKRALAWALVPAAWALVGWLPLVGLAQLASGAEGAGASTVRGFHAVVDHAKRIVLPPVPDLAANSLVFGLELTCAITVLAWIIGPENGSRGSRLRWLRFVLPLFHMPPLVLGAGVLALPWLAGLASRFSIDAGHEAPGRALENLSAALDPYRHPWILMAGCLLLVLAPWRFASGQAFSQLGAVRTQSPSASEAALVCGAQRARARGLGSAGQPGRWLGRFLLVWALAATNLTPSLLFSPWSDWRTVAPGVVFLAGGDGEARAQAATLALGAIAVNLGALAVARWTSALPRAVDLA
jgi:ABC-type Fe3+ transport system permease subunit